MTQTLHADLCIIGGGSGGLYVAAGAAQLGLKTVLIEKGKMGGDCLNYGCVPSKAMIAAAKAGVAGEALTPFGAALPGPMPYSGVHEHVHDVIAGIAPHDSVERFEGLGATVIKDHARFTGPREVVAGDTMVRARRFVIATGSRAAVPPIPGLADSPYLTNETLFDLTERPSHLVIIGGGPIGMEMAQAHRSLGADVTVIDAGRALGREDRDLADVVLNRLRDEGVTIHENSSIDRVSRDEDGSIRLHLTAGGEALADVTGSHLLVATGRTPTVDGMDLETAGIAFDKRGIKVDKRLRTSNKRVFAIGDCNGSQQFTHMASYEGGIVVRNALFRIPTKVNTKAIPRVTYTEPELAQVGMTESEARQAHGDSIKVFSFPYAENDRAQAERATAGHAKLVTDRKGRILGVGIAGEQAGEIIQPWILAMSAGLGVKALTGMIAPYPTLGEINKRLAGAFYLDTLFSERTKRLVRFLQRV